MNQQDREKGIKLLQELAFDCAVAIAEDKTDTDTLKQLHNRAVAIKKKYPFLPELPLQPRLFPVSSQQRNAN